MQQTAKEYMPLFYRAEWKAFGFTGTHMPFHVKELILDFEDSLMPQDAMDRLSNQVGRCLDDRRPLPEGVRIAEVRILRSDR